MQLRWQCAAFRVTSLSLETTCIRCTGQLGSIPTMHSEFHANQTAHYIIIITGRIVYLTEFWLVFIRMICVCTNRFIEPIFNAPRICCCWWLCLLIEVKNDRKPYAPAGLHRLLINTVHRRETNSKKIAVSFVPREKAREPFETAVLYGLFIRCTVEKRRCCTVFPTESGAAP